MKTTFRIAFACAVLVMTAACGKDYHRKQVEQYVLEAQQVTPTQVDPATVLASVEIEGDDVVYRYVIDENLITIEAFSQQDELLRNEFNDRRTRDSDMGKFVKAVSDAHMRIVMVYQGNVTHDTFTISFPLEELAVTQPQ